MTQHYEKRTLAIGSIVNGASVKTICVDMIARVSPDVDKMPISDRGGVLAVLDAIESSEKFVVSGTGRQVTLYTIKQGQQGEIVLEGGLESWYDEYSKCVMVAVMASDCR